MNRLISVVAIATLFFGQTGCATIVSGKSQDVTIRSNPAGAKVLIDGMMAGTTPLLADLKRSKRHEIKIVKEGYVEEMRGTKRGFNWWFAGNIIFGGIIGIIVDFATGGVYKVEPDVFNVELTESGKAKEVKSS